jgi:hypothetical protein
VVGDRLRCRPSNGHSPCRPLLLASSPSPPQPNLGSSGSSVQQSYWFRARRAAERIVAILRSAKYMLSGLVRRSTSCIASDRTAFRAGKKQAGRSAPLDRAGSAQDRRCAAEVMLPENPGSTSPRHESTDQLRPRRAETLAPMRTYSGWPPRQLTGMQDEQLHGAILLRLLTSCPCISAGS